MDKALFNNNSEVLNRGFTFIEMIIVMGMLSVIGVAIFTTLSNGINIWNRLNQAVTQEDINIFFDRFSSQLRNALNFSTIEFKGDKHEISFASIVTTPEKVQSQNTGIGQVTYTYNKSKKTITRQVKNYSQLHKRHKGLQQELLGNIHFFEFNYYSYNKKLKEYFWQDEWWRQEGLPLSVRIELEFQDDKEYKNIIRTIDIPIAQVQE